MKFVPNFMSSDRLVEAAYRNIALINQHCPDPKVIFDIGSNVGVFSCIFAEKYPDETIHAFEPIRPTYEVLLKNIKNNGFTGRIHAYNVALWSNHGRIRLGMPNNKDQRNSGLYSIYCEGSPVEVNARTLDDITTAIPDLIKADAEGVEGEIIRGGAKKFAAAKCIYIERGKYPIPGAPPYTIIEDLLRRAGLTQIAQGHDEIWTRTTNE